MIFLNTILKHVLGLCTLMFVIIPFINSISNGAMIPSAMAAGMPSLSSFSLASLIPNGGAHGFAPSITAGGSMYLGSGKPIFLN